MLSKEWTTVEKALSGLVSVCTYVNLDRAFDTKRQKEIFLERLETANKVMLDLIGCDSGFYQESYDEDDHD